MQAPVYGYFISADPDAPQAVASCLMDTQLSGVWVRMRDIRLAASGRNLLMVELLDVESGAPLDADGLGQRLSLGERSVLFVAEDPTGRGAAFELFQGGEQVVAWGGELERFAVTVGRDRHEGAEGFCRAFAQLAGLDWHELMRAASTDRQGGPGNGDEAAADGRSLVLLRGRMLAIPAGMPRRPQLFRVHYGGGEAAPDDGAGEGEADPDEGGAVDAAERDEPASEEATPGGSDDGERMMLVLLDARLSHHLWQEAPAAHASRFLRAIDPICGRVLGPLAGAVPDVVARVREQEPERALAGSHARDLLVYEVISMATAVGFAAGDTVAYFDRLFFPLLNLLDRPVSVDAIRSSADEIRGMSLLSAMVEVLPYAAPEGELLESFADEELSPLAAWASADGLYEGSLFLLDVERLRDRLASFDRGRLVERVREFRQAWSGGEGSTADERELARFIGRVEELRWLLELARANELQPAILFYGD